MIEQVAWKKSSLSLKIHYKKFKLFTIDIRTEIIFKSVSKCQAGKLG